MPEQSQLGHVARPGADGRLRLEADGQIERQLSRQSRTHYEFRWWYEYSGGKMTDWGAHHVDIATWAIGMENSGPTSVEGVMAEHPVPFKDGWPTVDQPVQRGDEVRREVPVSQRRRAAHSERRRERHLIEGDKGELFVSRGDLARLGGRCAQGQAAAGGRRSPSSTRGRSPATTWRNFFECIKDRTQPISDVYTHHRAMTTCHLANIAIRLGRKLKWNPETEQIVGDDDANGWLKREQRKGYEIMA